MAADSMGSPARRAQMRATFIPCSASGMAHPMMTSSISRASREGTRSSAPRMAAAPRSSGRVARRVPFGALPTAVRTALTITAFSILVSQRLACLERVGDSLLRLLFAAQGKEALAFEVQVVLFADQGTGRDGAAAHH